MKRDAPDFPYRRDSRVAICLRGIGEWGLVLELCSKRTHRVLVEMLTGRVC